MNSFSAHNLTTTGFSMNEHTEELLVQYCDGTLSASDQARFEILLHENPAFAEEVRAITSFDDMIDHAHLETHWADRVDTAFLNEMQQHFAQVATLGTAMATVGASTTASIGTSTSTATASALGTSASAGISASSAVSFLTGTIIGKSLLVAGVCTALGYGAWRYSAPSSETLTTPVQNSQAETKKQVSQETLHNQITTPNSTPSVNIKPSGTSTQADGNGNAGTSSQQAQQQQISQSLEAMPSLTTDQDDKSKTNANIESNAAQDLRNKIERLALQLRIKEQSDGDKASIAFDAKKLGMLERTAGKYAESNDSFEKALKAAQALKLRELEGEIRAEFALLYREQGNAEKALAALREAVKILTEEASAKAGRWAKELERWEKH